MPATAAPIAGFAAVRRSRAAPRRGGLRPDAARRPAAARPLARVPRGPFDELREVMRLAGLRVATDLRDFVAGLPRRAPLAPAFAELLADAALAALAFLALFLLGLVGFRAMAGLLAGPYTGRAESRRGARRWARHARGWARRGPCRSCSGSRSRRSGGSRGCRSRGSGSCRSRSGFRGRRLSRRGFPGGGALGSRTLGSRTLGLLGGRPAGRLPRLDRLAAPSGARAARGRSRTGLALGRRALSGLLLGPGRLRLRFPSSFSHNVLLLLLVRLHHAGRGMRNRLRRSPNSRPVHASECKRPAHPFCFRERCKACGCGPPVAQSSSSTVWTIGISVTNSSCVIQPRLPAAMTSGATLAMFAAFLSASLRAIIG